MSKPKPVQALSGTARVVNKARILSRPTDVASDVTYENERGSSVDWSVHFSKKALLPTDSPPWSSESGALKDDIRQTTCPKGWEWASNWIVDMNGDLDSGWSYGSQFSADKWQGSCTLGLYVRRRRWIRTRRLISPSSTNAIPAGGELGPTSSTKLVSQLSRYRLDSEKLRSLEETVSQLLQMTPISSKEVDAVVPEILSGFDFQDSCVRALKILAPLIQEKQAVAEKCRPLFIFYSDWVGALKCLGVDPVGMIKVK